MREPTLPRSEGRLAAKVILVTGGTTGIGRASAELFHAEGATVIVTGRDGSSLERARRELPSEVDVVKADARSISDATLLAETVRLRHGHLDGVFLNAGIAQLAPFELVDEAHYDAHMDTNVKGVVFTLQKVLPLLAQGGSVVVNTSIAANKGAPNMAIYAASKGAVSALVRTLALEMAPRGVRVNALSPAPIETEIQRKFGLDAATMEELRRDYSARIPLGRFGVPREVAELALFLLSPAASYLTGAEFPVDGGLLAA